MRGGIAAMVDAGVLAALLLLLALLYSSVGHGGASGYLASMALLSVSAHYETLALWVLVV